MGLMMHIDLISPISPIHPIHLTTSINPATASRPIYPSVVRKACGSAPPPSLQVGGRKVGRRKTLRV
jgi:hypothetical protein